MSPDPAGSAAKSVSLGHVIRECCGQLCGVFQRPMRLNTKRAGQLTAFEAWSGYYAGYPIRFALRIIKAFAPPHALVLDPWNGSGTTVVAAGHLGLRGLGVDLNPYAQVLAEARMYRMGPGAFRRAVDEALRTPPELAFPTRDALGQWVENAEFVRTFQNALACQTETHDTSSCSGRAFASLFTIQALRRALSIRRSSNPTWVKVPSTPLSLSHDEWSGAVRAELSTASTVLEELLPITEPAAVSIGDARSLELDDESIDFILTSPPYCTRIDYAVATSLELAFVGLGRNSSEFDKLRRALMGTTCVRKEVHRPPTNQQVEALLGAISSHPSHESSGYYLKNFRQYFSDLAKAVHEIARVLRKGAEAFLVVQDSYYKDIHIDLPAIVCSLAEQYGLQSGVLSDTPVPRSIVEINTKAISRSGRRTYREQVLRLTKPSK